MPDIDVNYLSEAINDKMDRDGHNAQSPSAIMMDSYINGSSGYRIWSDGYCEQWGQTDNNQTQTIFFIKEFANTNYNTNVTAIQEPSTSGGSVDAYASNFYTSSMIVTSRFNGTYASFVKSWRTSGYLAEGEY